MHYRLAHVTGFLPQDVIGNAVFDYFTDDDQSQLRDLLLMTMKTEEKIVSPMLSLKTVKSSSIAVRVVLSSFRNPLTGDFEHTLLDITVMPSDATFTSNPITMDCSHRNPANEDPVSPHTQYSSATSFSNSAALFSGSNDGDDEIQNETNRAMMMSLIGADGGLGGAVEASNISWPFS